MSYRFSRRKGPSADLMPSIMGEIEDRLANHSVRNKSGVRRTPCSNGFANLSPNVQKILSNVPDQELTNTFSSEESLNGPKRRTLNKSLRKSPDKCNIQKSTESIDVTPSVQKMLSNLPDTELVLPTCGEHKTINRSFLHVSGKEAVSEKSEDKSNVVKSDSNGGDCVSNNDSETVKSDGDAFQQKPLGSYLHSTTGIASRTPVGRKHLGGFLQIPSESSMGTNSTASSEVSRPVSLTSLGSCSSSSSSGLLQPSSAYMASAESLDSDPEPTGSQGSADSGIAEQSNMAPDQRVLQEVVETETVYVSDLRQVIQGYLEPWRADPDCLLKQHIPHLFSNLEQIYEFNKSFLEELREADCDASRTAEVFLNNDVGFSIYTEYCTKYPRTMSVLIDLMQNDKMSALFRERQTLLEHALPLGSYLLKPVQRILKYHLLLQRLSKHCDPEHKEKVDQAVATMANVATHINNMKKKHEHDLRVQEIQSQLYGWTGPDLTTLGELIAEGTFRVRGARGRRHVFLFDKLLLMAKGKQDGGLTYKSHIMCSNLMLLEHVKGEPLCFHILPFDNPRLQSTLRARSPQHKREWTLQLKRVILENYSAVIPSHARQLVMQLGQDIVADVDNTNERWSPLKQYSTPQYLERRSRIRNSRDLSNRRSASQDRFPSLTRWRRKSEPFDIQQYNTKTIPRKISKLKKTKDMRAKFYTDFSDSENYDVICESTDSLNVNDSKLQSTCEDIEESSLESNEVQVASTTLEQVVSDLLMQNQDFQKILNRRKNIRDSEPGPGIWTKPESESLPPKSDSLPRSFQLNDANSNHSITPTKVPDVDIEEEDFDDSQLEKDEHPEHKIYRKSTIRFSLLQRFRAMISEEQKKNIKLPTYKQGSKRMGAKIANPHYADPQKLFASTSQINLNEKPTETTSATLDVDVNDLIGEPEKIDLSLNESEVLSEFDRRLRISRGFPNQNITDTGQTSPTKKMLTKFPTMPQITTSIMDVVQTSKTIDSYYESILEKNLSDGECTSEDFYTSSDTSYYSHRLTDSQSTIDRDSSMEFKNVDQDKSVIKRPMKAPPPIPVKPARLSLCNNKTPNKSDEVNKSKDEALNSQGITKSKSDNGWFNLNLNTNSTINGNNVISFFKSETLSKRININSSYDVVNQCHSVENRESVQAKGWVKMIVDRFE